MPPLTSNKDATVRIDETLDFIKTMTLVTVAERQSVYKLADDFVNSKYPQNNAGSLGNCSTMAARVSAPCVRPMRDVFLDKSTFPRQTGSSWVTRIRPKALYQDNHSEVLLKNLARRCTIRTCIAY